MLRENLRAEPEVYGGMYVQTSKLFAAKHGTLTTSQSVKRMTEKSRASDRAILATMNVLEVENAPGLLVAKTEDQVTINVFEDQSRTSGD